MKTKAEKKSSIYAYKYVNGKLVKCRITEREAMELRERERYLRLSRLF